MIRKTKLFSVGLVFFVACQSFERAELVVCFPPFPAEVQNELTTALENVSQPEGKQVELPVAILHTKNPHPKPDPVIYLAGGGGFNMMPLLPFYLQLFGDAILRDRDLVLYNQRGAPLSEPALPCPGYGQLLYDLARDSNLSQEEQMDLKIDFLAGCHDELIEEGINLEMYNTLQSASDLEDLRIALGIETWDLYSVSYGTRVALEAMRQYPDGIHSVVLDSVLPPDVDPIAEAPHNVGHALSAFFESCRTDQFCAEAFPDLEDLFFSTAAQLNDQPVQVPVANMLTGDQYNTIVDGNVLIGDC